MRPEYGSLFDDLFISSATGIIRLMFKIAKDGLTKTNWVSTICITVGTIMLGVLAGFLANKTNIDLLHNYHDIIVSLSVLYGKMGLEKLEETLSKKKITITIPGLEDESKENVSGRATE